MPQPLSAGLVQGMLFALLMVIQKSAIDVLAKRFPGSVALWAPPLITGLGSAAVLILVHRLGGTPRIAQTITLPLIVSTSYATIYTFASFAREARRCENDKMLCQPAANRAAACVCAPGLACNANSFYIVCQKPQVSGASLVRQARCLRSAGMARNVTRTRDKGTAGRP